MLAHVDCRSYLETDTRDLAVDADWLPVVLLHWVKTKQFWRSTDGVRSDRRGPTAKNKVLQLVKALRKTCRVLGFSCWVSQKIVIYSNFSEGKPSSTFMESAVTYSQGSMGVSTCRLCRVCLICFPPPDSHGSVKNGCI